MYNYFYHTFVLSLHFFHLTLCFRDFSIDKELLIKVLLRSAYYFKLGAWHDIVIYNKKYIFGLHSYFWN